MRRRFGFLCLGPLGIGLRVKRYQFRDYFHSQLPTRWLRHADARQVSDLPENLSNLPVYDRGSETLRRRRSVAASQRLAAHHSGKPLDQ